MNEQKESERRSSRVLRNIGIMLFFGILIVAGLALTGFDVKALGLTAVEVPNEYKALTDSQVTDIIFSNIYDKRVGLFDASAEFTINNIFSEDLQIKQDYILYRGDEPNVTYYYWTNITKDREVQITGSEMVCYEKNASCYNQTTNNGTKTIKETTTGWVETQIIPANYNGYMKVEADFKHPAYKREVIVDWIPKIETRQGLEAVTYKQTKWAMFNSSYNKRYSIHLNNSIDAEQLTSPRYINLSEWGVTCNNANYSELILTANDSVQIPWQYHGEPETHETIFAFLNSTTTTNTDYQLYCDCAGASDQNESIAVFHEIADGVTDNADFTRRWFPGAGVVAVGGNATMNQNSTVVMAGHGDSISFEVNGGTAGRNVHWDDRYTGEFVYLFNIRDTGYATIDGAIYLTDNVSRGDVFLTAWSGNPTYAYYHSGGFGGYYTEFAPAEWQTVKNKYQQANTTWLTQISNDSVTYFSKYHTSYGSLTGYNATQTYLNTGHSYYIDDIYATDNLDARVYKNVYELEVIEEALPPDVYIIDLEETPADPTTYGTEIKLNATIINLSNSIGDIVITFDGTNYTTVTNETINTTARETMFTTSILTAGVYNYIWYANDTSGSEAIPQSGSITVVENINIENLEETPAEPSNYGEAIRFNATITHGTNTSTIDQITFEFNGVNYTTITNESINTTAYESEINMGEDITDGTYTYYWYANSTTGLEADRQTGTYEVNETLALEQQEETPASPATWGGTYEFNITATHGTNTSIIDTVVLEFDGTNYTVDSETINTTAKEYNYTFIGLGIGDYDYYWYANTTTGVIETRHNGTYNITSATNNTVNLSVVPNGTVTYGTTILITCSASVGTPYIAIDGITYGTSPQSVTLATGTRNVSCFVSATNYTYAFNWTEVEIRSLAEGSAGCSNNLTYALSGLITVTNNNTTVIDMQNYIDLNLLSEDISDIYISGYDYWTNSTRYLVINTTGAIGNQINVSFGNTLNNMSIPKWNDSTAVTNTFDNVSIVNNYVILNFVDEIEQTSEFPDNLSSLELDLFCIGGQTHHELNVNSSKFDYIFATNSTYNETLATAEYSDSSLYTRNIMFDNARESGVLFFLIDAQNYSTAKVVNQLVDYTGQFSFPNNANITIKKWIGSNLRTVDKRTFDASNLAYFYGIIGNKYSYYVQNVEEERTFGEVVVDSLDLDKTIVISQTSRSSVRDIEYMGNITYYADYNNTTGVFTFYWNDPYNQTNNINLTLTNIDNDTVEYFAESTSNVVTFSKVVGNTTARYRYEVQYDHNIDLGLGVIAGWVVGGIKSTFVLIGNSYFNILLFMAVCMIVLSTSYFSYPLGMFVSSALLIFFKVMGMLSMTWSILAVALGFAILVIIRRLGEEN
jgi:hypothetical protein